MKINLIYVKGEGKYHIRYRSFEAKLPDGRNWEKELIDGSMEKLWELQLFKLDKNTQFIFLAHCSTLSKLNINSVIFFYRHVMKREDMLYKGIFTYEDVGIAFLTELRNLPDFQNNKYWEILFANCDLEKLGKSFEYTHFITFTIFGLLCEGRLID